MDDLKYLKIKLIIITVRNIYIYIPILFKKRLNLDKIDFIKLIFK